MAWLIGRLTLAAALGGGWVVACSSTGSDGALGGKATAGSSSGGEGQGAGGSAQGQGGAQGPGQGGATGGSGQGQGQGQGGAGGNNPFGGAAGTGIVIDGGGSDVIEEGCAGIEAKATRVPLTLFIAIDRSQSLSGTKWDSAKKGLKAFLEDPASADINVGLVTFPRAQISEQCSFKNYQDPEAPFGKLPGNAQAVLDLLDKTTPNGFGSPIYPALGGVLQRGAITLMQTPTENFAVLLITDGTPASPPDSCNGVDALDVNSVYGLAESTLAKYKVKTFVLGLPGMPPEFANTLATKGGGSAVVIKTDLDLQKQFQDALADLRGEGLGCEYPLPPDSTKYDKDLVNVKYTKGDTTSEDLDRSLGCASGKGWDYDNAATPTKILLCGATCDAVKKDGLAKVDVVLGCPTRGIN